MRLVIASSKNWFKIDKSFYDQNDVMEINERSKLTKTNLDNFCPNFIFFPHWSWVVPENIYQSYRCILFHTAPLPYGRGGSPIQNLILNGYTKAPVCALEMGAELDAGDILGKVDIDLDGKLSDIFIKMNVAVNSLIKKIITSEPKSIPQTGHVVEFKRLNQADNEIPEGLSINEIFDRIRMLDHDEYPNAFLIKNNYKIDFITAKKCGDTIDCVANISLLKKDKAD